MDQELGPVTLPCPCRWSQLLAGHGAASLAGEVIKVGAWRLVRYTSASYPVTRCHPVYGHRVSATSVTSTRVPAGCRWWWACQDLNLGPRPYQQPTGNRCADDRFRRSRATVGDEVTGSIGAQLRVLPWPPDARWPTSSTAISGLVGRAVGPRGRCRRSTPTRPRRPRPGRGHRPGR